MADDNVRDLLEKKANKAYNAHIDARVARLLAEVDHIKRPTHKTHQALEAAKVEDRRARTRFVKATDELRAATRTSARRAA